MLASFVAVPRLTSNASRGVVGQWGGAGGASCEDHPAFCGELLAFAGWTRLEKPDFFASQRRRATRTYYRADDHKTQAYESSKTDTRSSQFFGSRNQYSVWLQ